MKCSSKLVPTNPAPDRQLLLERKSHFNNNAYRRKAQLIDLDLDPVDELIKQRIQEFIDYLIQETEEYDIYHSQDCISTNALTVMRSKGIIANFIRTVHHIDKFNSPYLQECHDLSILKPDLCLCVSKYWQEQLQQQYQIDAPVIINGVDTKRFSSQSKVEETKLKERLNIRSNPVYLTIGGIEPRKNSLKLLEAFIELLKTHPQAQLIIVGGETLFDYEPYRLKFFNLAQQYKVKIGESLIIPGVMADAEIPVLYRCADAFVFPSVKEGWGLVLLEAIASRLPIITSNIPPFTEFLTKDSALLVNPDSSQDITHAMKSILNTDKAEKLISNSSHIPSQYSWRKSAQMHLKHYAKLSQTH